MVNLTSCRFGRNKNIPELLRRSPLLTYTAELTNQLNSRSGKSCSYGNAIQEPSMDKVLEEMRLLNYDRTVLPSFRTTHPR